MGKQRNGMTAKGKIVDRSRSAGQSKRRVPVRLVFLRPILAGRDDAVRALISGGLARLMAESIARSIKARRDPVRTPDKVVLDAKLKKLSPNN
jgi:hypothetical protein